MLKLFGQIKHACLRCARRRIWLPQHLLPLLFVIMAGPTVLIQVYLTPPMQVADEDNHLLRATQISEGHVFGRRRDAVSGGGVDSGAVLFAHAFDDLKFRPDVKVTPSVYGTMSQLRWRTQPPTFVSFANTAIYPFFLYLPASVALSVGRHAGLTIMDSFYLARLATAMVSLGLVTLALHLCGQGRTLLFVILCFPMTLSLFASVSQDALSISLGALAAALWSRHVARGAPMPVGTRMVIALAIGAVAAARLPFLPFYALAVMPTRVPPANSRPRARDVLAASTGLVPLAIGILGAHLAKVPFRTEDNVSVAGQLSWILAHPGDAWLVASRTVSHDALRHLHDMIGQLGWLDTELPKPFYTAILRCVIVATAVDALLFRRAFVPRWGWLPLVAVLTTTAGIFAALYLAWTPVGAGLIDGVQGRYFLLPAIIFAVSMPGLRIPQSDQLMGGARLLQGGLCLAVALFSLWVVPITLIHRYYG